MTGLRLSAIGQRRLAVFATLVVAAFVLFFPARHLILQRERISALEERRTALRAENERLSDRAAQLSDPAEVEALIRDRLGHVRPGEKAYFVEPTQAPDAPASSEDDPSLWSRAWTWVTSLVRGRS